MEPIQFLHMENFLVHSTSQLLPIFMHAIAYGSFTLISLA
jgi:hypothetical protein